MRHRLTTLRGRLLVGTALTTAAILLAAGVAVYAFVRVSLMGEFDRSLEASVRALAAMTEYEGGTMRMEPEALTLAEFNRKREPDYFAAWTPDGAVVAQSRTAEGRALPHPTPPVGRLTTEVVTLPDGLPGRQATLTFVPPVEGENGTHTRGTIPVTLTVAAHVGAVRRQLAELAWLLAGT